MLITAITNWMDAQNKTMEDPYKSTPAPEGGYSSLKLDVSLK